MVAEARAEQAARAQLVWDFDRSLTNYLGGTYNVYAREPSWARTYLDPNVHRPSSRHSLRITVHRETKGFCGVWFNFYSRVSVPARFLAANSSGYLSFWVKGDRGGEDFDITLTDENSQKSEEGRPARPLHAYLPRGAASQWQEVLIPLRDFSGLNPERLSQMVLGFQAEGDYRIYLGDVALKPEKSAPAGKPADGAPLRMTDAKAPARRAMWVWNTQTLIDPAGKSEADRFFEFCAREKLRQIYLALNYTRLATDAGPRFDLRDRDRYREFLARAHGAGLEVEGLAGTPEWAARENHPLALAAVGAVLDFNRASPQGARFDGLHFDVEPYSLLGYSDPATRGTLLQEFLEMVAKCLERVRSEPGLRFGCDVPAWFYPQAMLERVQLTVPFNGTEKTVGEHLTDMLDSVTVMDYHNEADGAGGIVVSALAALDYAASRGKKIFVGLETSLESESTVHFVCGLPVAEFQKRLAGSALRHRLFLGDWRLATFSDEINVHIGLSARGKLEGREREEFEAALARLARELGAASDPDHFPSGPIMEEARAAIEQDADWNGFEPYELMDAQTQRTFSGFRATHRMSPRITFHGLGRKVFEEERRSASEWLSDYSSFGGLAIHYYETYRSLVEGK